MISDEMGNDSLSEPGGCHIEVCQEDSEAAGVEMIDRIVDSSPMNLFGGCTGQQAVHS